jgi:hypothetical protein
VVALPCSMSGDQARRHVRWRETGAFRLKMAVIAGSAVQSLRDSTAGRAPQ